MDPIETLLDLLTAVVDQDTEELGDRAHDLLRWLQRGGASPLACVAGDAGPAGRAARFRFVLGQLAGDH